MTFSLRTLFAVIFICGLVAWFVAREGIALRSEKQSLARIGAVSEAEWKNICRSALEDGRCAPRHYVRFIVGKERGAASGRVVALNSNCDYTSFVLEKLYCFPHLKQVHISAPVIPLSVPRRLESLTHLDELTIMAPAIERENPAQEAQWDDLARHRLTSLSLSGFPGSLSVCLRVASRIPTLRHLTIHNDGYGMTAQDRRALSQCCGLRTLTVKGFGYGVEDWRVFAELPELTYLDVCGDYITDAMVHELARTRSLRDLLLCGVQSNMTKKSLLAFASIASLETLAIPLREFASEDIDNFRKLRPDVQLSEGGG